MNVPAFVRRSAPKNRNARDAEIAEVRRRAGCSDFTARRRLNAFAAGTIDEAALYAPIVRTPKREIEQALPCPVTGGCPTRMTAGAFTAHCEARRGAFVGDEYANIVFRRRCDDCKGEPDNWPDELSVLEPAAPPVQDNEEKKEKQEDQAMANKPANCELCGQKAALKTSHNFNVCPTCVKVMQYTGNHADKIATAAKHLGKDVELARGLGLETGSDSTPSESARALDELKAGAAELLGCPKDEIVPALRLVRTTMETIREVVEPELEGEEYDSLPEACRLLVARYHAARDAERDASEDEATAAGNAAVADAARQAFGADLGADDLAHTIMGLSERLRERETEIEWLRREAAKPGRDPMDEALLSWAVARLRAGRVRLDVRVEEVAEAAA